MSDLSNRLRDDADFVQSRGWESAADTMREAAAELDRLDSIVGKAAAYTDDAWAAREVARGSMSSARDGLGAAQGYWERHLAATGGR